MYCALHSFTVSFNFATLLTIIIVNLQATQLEMTVGSNGLDYYDISLVVSVILLSLSCSLPSFAREGVCSR